MDQVCLYVLLLVEIFPQHPDDNISDTPRGNAAKGGHADPEIPEVSSFQETNHPHSNLWNLST